MVTLMQAAHIRLVSFKDDGKARIKALIGDEKGVTALEYGLIAAVIVSVVSIGFGTMAGQLSSKFVTIGNGL